MSIYTRVTADVIEPQAVLACVGSAADGAVLLFLGTVRADNAGRAVRGMQYAVYAEMAEPVLAEIAAAAAAQCGSDRLAVVHRTGELSIGEVSVAIAVSSPHRAEAFDAARFIIEQIKQRLPVWKREHYADGDVLWLSGALPPGAA
ncbi:MAG TPA: molybdenum cofactor biosynthesis protein MoaE [Longimicrobiales bacterium]|nr:molybdenum cofactor biosynthesis protein MoaE [Longimicrobiales bacterium]